MIDANDFDFAFTFRLIGLRAAFGDRSLIGWPSFDHRREAGEVREHFRAFARSGVLRHE